MQRQRFNQIQLEDVIFHVRQGKKNAEIAELMGVDRDKIRATKHHLVNAGRLFPEAQDVHIVTYTWKRSNKPIKPPKSGSSSGFIRPLDPKRFVAGR